MDWTKVPEALERLLKSGVQYGIVMVLLAAGVFWWDGQQPAGMHLKDVGAWAYWLAVVILVLGAVVSAVALGSLAFQRGRQFMVSHLEKRSRIRDEAAVDEAAIRGLGGMTDDERVIVKWLMVNGQQHFYCQSFREPEITALVNRRIIGPDPVAEGRGSFVIRDNLWAQREHLVQQWSYLPHAFKPDVLLTVAEHTARRAAKAGRFGGG